MPNKVLQPIATPPPLRGYGFASAEFGRWVA